MAHSVSLTWVASTDTVTGYNIYRGTTSEQEATLLDASPVTGTSFVDSTPLLGKSFYIVRSVLNGTESVNSNEVTVVILPAAPTGLVAVAS
jgi:fibronectin type 3 domain-containing protein